MRIVKTILVILIGVSVALLPAAPGFATSAPPPAASMSMPGCDHHMQAPAEKTQKSDSDCILLANCVFHCFSVTGIAAAVAAFESIIGIALQPLLTSDCPSPQLGSLPFRPPRA